MKIVTITLTIPQALAMSHALGNSVDHEDAMKALFATGAERRAAFKAAQKLDDAIRSVDGFKPKVRR